MPATLTAKKHRVNARPDSRQLTDEGGDVAEDFDAVVIGAGRAARWP